MRDILSFIITLCLHEHGVAWLRSEMNRRLSNIRDETPFAQRIIPAHLEELTDQEIDDVVTGFWLMAVRVDIDIHVLLELDVLGTALDLVGCTTRFDQHVQDALKAQRQNQPLKDLNSATHH